MRLLKYEEDGQLTITSFDDNAIPPYAILSHTWGADAEEVTFADLTKYDGKGKRGYKKIHFCGEQARHDRLQYFWVDTCCIDKTDKAELSQAIRSMFRWYQNATKCYVYLSDVSTRKRKFGDMLTHFTWKPAFTSSRWFTRGWTLQELLAPSIVEFFSQEWEKLGDKMSLKLLINKATGIPYGVLDGAPLSQFSVDERLRWKGDRDTKLEEDIWYSLSGIFNVEIAPAYSEGAASAFKRLIDEIYKLKTCVQDIRHTDPCDDKKRIEETKGGLLADSYRWVLDNTAFQQWQQNPHSRLLWVKGDPGKGKTMLLCGIIDELQSSMPRTALLSYFFCQATHPRINSATAVLRGLLYMLVTQQPSLVSHIRKKHDYAGKTLFEDANAWVALTEIWVNVLRDSSLRMAYLIIDALDECIIDLPKLLHFIAVQSSTGTSHRVKWIVSSRNWPEIEKRLEPVGHKVRLSLELNAESVSTAVDTFIRKKVSQLVEQEKYDKKTQDTVLEYLTANADDTFLWVALACQNLEGTAKRNVVKKLKSIPPGLDPLYKRMMHQISELDDAEICRCVLASTAILYRPVTILELVALVEQLNDFVNDLESVREIVSFCGSFLTLREDTVYFVHQSAKDFLFTKAHNEAFPDGTEAAHQMIFLRSLAILSRTLHKDMYSLKALGYPFKNVKPPNPDPLAVSRYPCVYWIDHLYDSKPKSSENSVSDLQIAEVVAEFLRKKYLYWLEGLSLCRNVGKGVVSMTKLWSLVQWERYDRDGLTQLIQDAWRFIMYHKGAIEGYPLQTYASALLFSPTGSLVRRLFKHEEPTWITIRPKMKNEWGACLQTLEDLCNMVTFPRDSSRLASATCDKMVKIWDASSGACLQTLEGHSSSVHSVAFSYDSTRLASMSYDGTVKVWDANSGDCLSTLHSHGAEVWLLVFSHDLTWLASVTVSDNKTVKIWNSTSGECLSTIEGHDDEEISSLAISHDSTRLAVGFDSMVGIWDFTSSKYVQTLEWSERSAGRTMSLAFSHNSVLLGSGLGDGMIMIFDVDSGEVLRVLDSHSCGVASVAFSHDSTRLASASDDWTVKTWDLSNTMCLQTLDGHNSPVHSVAFSYDSTQLASVSRDGSTKIWDTSGGESMQTPDDHGNPISSIVFSPDSTRLASSSHDCTIKIWDMSSKRLQTLHGHTSTVYMAVFSHDSTLLASASSDETARVWDLISGKCLSTFRGHNGEIAAVAFSHDSMVLASASLDRTIKLWNVGSGECLSTLKGHSDQVTSVAFSHDSTQLASLSEDRTVKVWNTRSGECRQMLECHSGPELSMAFPHDGPASSIAFSHEATQLASVSSDCAIKIWDLNSNKCLHTLDIGRPLSKISFDASDLYLSSDVGPIAIPAPSHPDGRVAASDLRSLVHHYGGLSVDRKWITYDSVNVLWLPSEYRPSCSAVSGNSIGVAIGVRVFMTTLSQSCQQ